MQGCSSYVLSHPLPVIQQIEQFLDRCSRTILRSVPSEPIFGGLPGCKGVVAARRGIAPSRSRLGKRGIARRQIAEVEEQKPAEALAPSLELVITCLQELIKTAQRALIAIDPQRAAAPLQQGGWSRKQVLGHLIDSASNNHQRFVRALTQPELTWPNYDGDVWVNSQDYASASWATLVQLWSSYNMHLVNVIGQIPEEKVGTICRIGDEAPMTLR